MLTNYREIMMEAVKQNGLALKDASAALKCDTEIVMAAVKQKWIALIYASAELQGDREIVLVTVKKQGVAISFASAALKGDRQIVMQAVQQDGDALQYASAALKGDREIVLVAVARSQDALQYASSRLRDGDFTSHLRHLIENVYNVPEPTIVATILFGAKAAATAAPTSAVKTKKTKGRELCFLSLLQPSSVLPGPLSTQIKQLIWAYAGVKSGAKWGTIKLAAHNLGIDKGKQPSL